MSDDPVRESHEYQLVTDLLADMGDFEKVPNVGRDNFRGRKPSRAPTSEEVESFLRPYELEEVDTMLCEHCERSGTNVRMVSEFADYVFCGRCLARAAIGEL